MKMTGRLVRILMLAALAVISQTATRADSGEGENATATPIADHYRAAAERIIDATLAGNEAYNKMEELCDDIGHRLSGSRQLEQAVRWAADAMKKDGQENVRFRSTSGHSA